jgi:hypothetical protein
MFAGPLAPFITVEPGGGGGWNRAPLLVGPELKYGETFAIAFIGTVVELVCDREPRILRLFIRLDVRSVVLDDEEKFIAGRMGCCGTIGVVGRRSEGIVWEVDMPYMFCAGVGADGSNRLLVRSLKKAADVFEDDAVDVLADIGVIAINGIFELWVVVVVVDDAIRRSGTSSPWDFIRCVCSLSRIIRCLSSNVSA